MTDQAKKNRAAIEKIRGDLNQGKISYEEAKILAEPTIRKINENAKEIARKYGRKFQAITFAEIIR